MKLWTNVSVTSVIGELLLFFKQKRINVLLLKIMKTEERLRLSPTDFQMKNNLTG